MDRSELERLDREGLVLRAQAAGVRRARLLTRPELIDELVRLGPIDASQVKKSRGFFGRARDLLTRVVERGLHLPDAADRLRSAFGAPLDVPRPEPQAVPTVTLAEIYASQGHKKRAVETLKRVLEGDPDHVEARALLAKLEAADYVAPPPPVPPETPEQAEQAEQAVAPPSEPRLQIEDRCLAIPEDEGVAVTWTLTAESARIEAFFFVRILVITPSWDGPTIETRDIACDSAAGSLKIAALPPGAVVRVAIGWFDQGTFVPIAHSPAIERAEEANLVTWTVDGFRPYVAQAV
jgi:hypothetical protein